MTTKKKRLPPYTAGEIGGTIALYFAMLDRVTSGRDYNKAASIRIAQGKDKTGDATAAAAPFAGFANTLKGRERPSIEFKLMNCTAAHQAIDSDAETMHNHGYRALPNYQAELKSAMAVKLETRRRCYIGSDGRRYA